MNHPKPEEWAPYVCGEATGAVRRQLKSHLQECRQCREEVETWKQSLARLDKWKLPSRHSASTVSPFLKWAAAATMVLLSGILVGRATAPKLNSEDVRQAIAAEVRRDLTLQVSQLVQEEVARNASLTLASGHRYTDQVAQQLYIMLKKDLDTVAVNADEGLRNTALQLVQLADYKEPVNPTNPGQ